MKYKQSRHSIQAAAALSAVLLSAPAFAQQAGNTNDEIASLKRQLGQLMEKTEQISAKQQADSTKQDQMAAKISSAQPQAVNGTAGRPVTARIGGTDVRLFGSFDTYFETQDTGGGVANRLVSSGSGFNQLGFDATKDLGNGLNVFGDVRLSYQADNGVANSTARTFNSAAVGLTKDTLGTLQAGRMGTAVGEALGTFGLIRLGTGNFIYHPFTTLTHNNMIKYTSPKFSNIQVSGSVDFGEVVGENNTGSGYGATVKYDNGKTVAIGSLFSSNSPTDISTPNNRVSISSLGASHDFGFVKPFLVMQQSKSDLVPVTLDQTVWYAGVDIPVGPGKLRLEAESLTNNAWANTDATSVNARYDWQLMAGTSVYFTYTQIMNKRAVYNPIVGTGGFAAVSQVNSNPLNPSFNTNLNGTSPSALGVGIKFDF
jgi:predicted porin